MVGRDVSTLHRIMKNGRLSYTTNSSGRRRLDPAELAWLFEALPMHGNGATQSMDPPQADAVQVVALLREAVQCRDAMLADLQRRLDMSEAERRQLSERLTAILTDQQGKGRASPTAVGKMAGAPKRLNSYCRSCPRASSRASQKC